MEAAKKLRGVIRGDENVEFDKFVEGGCYNFCRKKDLSIFCLNCRFNMLSAVPVCCLLSLSAVYKKRKGKLPPFFRLVN